MLDIPLLTRVYSNWSEFDLPRASCYIYARSSEERSEHPLLWEERHEGCSFVEITEQERFHFSANVGGVNQKVFIRNNAELSQCLSKICGRVFFLDITGLEHHIWASLLRMVVGEERPINAVYVEPERYRYSANPTEGRLFELTDKFTEISSFPGFARLQSMEDEAKTCFVPLLGFEGNRLAHAIEKIDPPVDKVLPVVGVPGFRADFPFYTYIGNRISLRDGLWKRVQFAIANSPISAMDRLAVIGREYSDHLLKIAPLGTRPHALGAVLFAIIADAQVELVYDYPTPAPRRSDGTGKILVYDVTSMVSVPWCPSVD